MNAFRQQSIAGVAALALGWVLSAQAAGAPGDWRHEQRFDVAAPGLVKFSLPLETLDASRPGLEDVRLYDSAGNELPYLVERPVQAAAVVRDAATFRVTLSPENTVIAIETGMTRPIDGVTLATPAGGFIKAVQIETSEDGRRWRILAGGQVIFRQPSGVSQLRVSFDPVVSAWVRLTVDDRRSPPVPFTGARVHAAAAEPAPSELLPATLAGRHENPGESRLTLNLGAANLDVVAIRIETAEPLFTRQVTVAAPEVQQDAIREETLAREVIYRAGVEGHPASDHLSITVGTQVRSRELLLLIRNEDSPPLPVTTVRVERRPVYVVFLARQGGTFRLLTGNSRCAAPRYDLAALRPDLKSAAVADVALSRLGANPDYRPPEALPGIEGGETAIDLAAWRFRKAVNLVRAGAQQLDLDLDILSHAQPGLQDLRLVRGDRQVPYVLERTSITRTLEPEVSAVTDPKDPKLSRWIIRLPRPGLPVTRLACHSPTPLFERQVTLYEEVRDDRGEHYRRTLATGSWVQTPERPDGGFVLDINGPLQSDILFLETHNGDNPPIQLGDFRAFHPVSRVLFKTAADAGLFLYYGNRQATVPRYDLALVAGGLLAADKAVASAGVEETLRKSWRDGRAGGTGGVLFWGILALVVVALLVVISRLLPKPEPPTPPTTTTTG